MAMPYRVGIGLVIFNTHGQVWTGRRLPKWAGDRSSFVWQLPQGGIDENEPPSDAALRELYEETNIRSVEVLAELPYWTTYDLPPELVGVALKGKYRGQRQKWFAMRFWGDDSEIDIGPRRGHKAEFDRWKWRQIEEIPELIVDFKRPVYEDLVAQFGKYAVPR
ncbi:MAG: RNA pyrophosphohydrolase [Hyphomicrobium sp.]|nr:RNA pyrophosphohydrolase [Hyphomicrobium sp.]